MNDSNKTPAEAQPFHLAASAWWWMFAGTAAFSFALSRETGAIWSFYVFHAMRGAVFIVLLAVAARTGRRSIGLIAVVLFLGSSPVARAYWERTAQGRDQLPLLKFQCLFVAVAGASLVMALFGRRLIPGREQALAQD